MLEKFTYIFLELLPIVLILLRIEHRLTKFEDALNSMCKSCGAVKSGDQRLLKLRGYVDGDRFQDHQMSLSDIANA